MCGPVALVRHEDAQQRRVAAVLSRHVRDAAVRDFVALVLLVLRAADRRIAPRADGDLPARSDLWKFSAAFAAIVRLTALALRSTKVQRVTVLFCEPPENETPFAPRCWNVHESKRTPFDPWKARAAGVSRNLREGGGGCSGESPGSGRQFSSSPTAQARQKPAWTSTNPIGVLGPTRCAEACIRAVF